MPARAGKQTNKLAYMPASSIYHADLGGGGLCTCLVLYDDRHTHAHTHTHAQITVYPSSCLQRDTIILLQIRARNLTFLWITNFCYQIEKQVAKLIMG